MMADVTSGKAWPSFLGTTAFREYGIYLALAALIIYFSILVPEFRTWNNALLILLQVSVIGIIAVGMTFTIITAGIDLSVGSLLAVAGIMSGLFAQKDPTVFNVALAFARTHRCRSTRRGTERCNHRRRWSKSADRDARHPHRLSRFRRLVPGQSDLQSTALLPVIGQGTLFGIPIPVLILALVAIVAWIILSFTRFGRYVYAVGGNREAARAAGINVGLVTFLCILISGLCVGIAALIFTSRIMAAQAISGQGFELQAIAAAVVGGASLFGGRGKISNTIVGALIMGVLFNGFVMLDVPQPIQQMAVGVIIIVAVWLDGVLRKRRRSSRMPGR